MVYVVSLAARYTDDVCHFERSEKSLPVTGRRWLRLLASMSIHWSGFKIRVATKDHKERKDSIYFRRYFLYDLSWQKIQLTAYPASEQRERHPRRGPGNRVTVLFKKL